MNTSIFSDERVRIYKKLSQGTMSRERAIRELKNLRLGAYKYE